MTSTADVMDAPEKEKKMEDEALNEFYSLIEQPKEPQEPSDPTWNSASQIYRLLKPGSGYLNLNPFEVLKVPYDANLELIKRRYKKLSVLVHPDKNSDDAERAQHAFEAVNRSYKQLMDKSERKKCLEVVDEAKSQLAKNMAEKRQRIKRENKIRGGRSTTIDEDQPEKYEKALRAVVCKLFMDLERLRVRDEIKKNEERKRKAEERVAEEKAAEEKKEWDKNYEIISIMWYDVLPSWILTAGPICLVPLVTYTVNTLWLGKRRVHRQNLDHRDFYMLLRDQRITGHPYESRGVEEIDQKPRITRHYNFLTK